MNVGQLIILLILGFFVILVLVAVAPPGQISTYESFTIETVNPTTEGWGDINATWNYNDTSITIPLHKTGSGNFRNNQTLIIFKIRPNPSTGVTTNDRDTIHVEILNPYAKINNRYLFYRTRGAFFANISDPDGSWSGNDYRSDYTFNYSESGEFAFAFKVDSAPNYSASYEFDHFGERVIIQIHFFDNEDFSKTYDINFTCVEV